MLTVMRPSDGPSRLATDTFAGRTWVDVHLPPTDGVTVGEILFEPRSRTYWHSHPQGQLLVIVAGRGFVATKDEVVTVRAGEKVWTPPGVQHWHGAAPDTFLLHTAVTLGQTCWGVEVTDAEYDAAR